eukprot:12112191-Ditylum_brightwellii.AAC.1
MNNNNEDNSSTVVLDEPSLSDTSMGLYDSDDSMWDMETLQLQSLGTLEEWMGAAKERISNIFWVYFLVTSKPKCLTARAA